MRFSYTISHLLLLGSALAAPWGDFTGTESTDSVPVGTVGKRNPEPWSDSFRATDATDSESVKAVDKRSPAPWGDYTGTDATDSEALTHGSSLKQ